MLKLLRFLFTGYWGPAPSVRSLNRRVETLEEGSDDLRRQIKRLRGWVTGGIRYEADDDSDLEEPDIGPSVPNKFPEEAFQRALEERRHG